MENKRTIVLACQRQLAAISWGLLFPLYDQILYCSGSMYLGISEGYGYGLKMLFCKRECLFTPLSRAGKAACTVTRVELIAIRMAPIVELCRPTRYYSVLLLPADDASLRLEYFSMEWVEIGE